MKEEDADDTDDEKKILWVGWLDPLIQTRPS
jgi:hypothetical protein